MTVIVKQETSEYFTFQLIDRKCIWCDDGYFHIDGKFAIFLWAKSSLKKIGYGK